MAFFSHTLQSSDSIVSSGDVIGRLAYAASNEVSGGDGILIAGAIENIAEGEFTAVANPASLVFSTSTSAAASEQMRLTSEGYLGINTQYPTSELHVEGNAKVTGAAAIHSAGTSRNLTIGGDTDFTAAIQILGSGMSGGSEGLLIAESNAGDAYIYNYENSPIYFGTNGGYVGGWASNGGFMVGGSTSSYGPGTIQLYTNGSPRIKLTNLTTGQGVNDGSEMYLDFGDLIITNRENGDLSLKTNDETRIFIQDDGDVGVGTESPSYKLDVAGSTRFRAGDNENILAIADSGTVLVQTQGATYVSANNDCRYTGNKGPFVINNYYDGTNPVDKDSVLQINNRSNNFAQTIDFTTGTVTESSDQGVRWASISKPQTSTGLQYRLYAGTNPAGYSFSPSHEFYTVKSNDATGTQYQTLKMKHDEFTAYTSGVERIFIDDEGKVGIGTTSPTELLDVNSGTENTQMVVRNSEGVEFKMQAYSSGGTGRLGLIGTTSDDPFYLRTNNTNRLSLDSNLITVNPVNADTDLQVRGTSDNNIIRVDAANDRLGVGIFNPSYKLDVAYTAGEWGLFVAQAGDTSDGIGFGDWTTDSNFQGMFHASHGANEYIMISNGTDTYIGAASGGETRIRGGGNSATYQLEVAETYVTLAGSLFQIVAGETRFNANNADQDVTFEGVSDTQLLNIDAGLDKIGIGVAVPEEKIHVDGTIKSEYGLVVDEINGAIGAKGFVERPANCRLSTNSASESGYLKIRLPADPVTGNKFTNTMLMFDVEMYEYKASGHGGAGKKFTFGGYAYGANDTWLNVTSSCNYFDGDIDNSNPWIAKFCKDPDDYPCVLLYKRDSEENTAWEYPQVVISNIIAGFSNITYDHWSTGWELSFEKSTDLSGYSNFNTKYISMPYVTNQSSYNFYAGGDGRSVSHTNSVVFGSAASIFNTTQNNVDFRVAGDTDYDAFFVDASADRVGVGESTPEAKLHVNGEFGTHGPQFMIEDTSSQLKLDAFCGNSSAAIRLDSAGSFPNTNLDFQVAGSSRLKLDANSNLSTFTTGLEVNTGVNSLGIGNSETRFNKLNNTVDFIVEGITDVSLFHVDAAADCIGIGTSSSVYKLEVIAAQEDILRLRSTPPTTPYAAYDVQGLDIKVVDKDLYLQHSENNSPQTGISTDNCSAIRMSQDSVSITAPPTEGLVVTHHPKFTVDTDNGRVTVVGDTFQIATSKTPSSATDTGTAGDIAWDADYIYVCTATDTWKRTAISTW